MYLHKRKQSYYFRIRIPNSLQPLFNGRREVSKSLGSLSHREALSQAQALSIQFLDTFDTMTTSGNNSFNKILLSLLPDGTKQVTVDTGSDSKDTEIAKELLSTLDIGTSNKTTDTTSVTLSVLVDSYLNEKSREGTWTAKTTQENTAIYTLMIRILGSIELSTVDYKAARKYKDTLLKLPPNLNKSKQYRDKSIEDILSTNVEHCMSITTVNKNLNRISTLFSWSVKNGYSTVNYFDGLQLKKANKPSDDREVYTLTDIHKLLNLLTKEYCTKDYYYWLPRLACYSGCRLDELCQLYCDDIYVLDGVTVIDINNKLDKKIKTKSGIRIVPVHSELVKLGFLDYVASMSAQGHDRVFPELKKNRDGYSATASKWFSRVRNKLEFNSKQNFHSFRHTVANQLKQKDIVESRVAELVGHSNGSITYSRYGKEYDVQSMAEVVELIDYSSPTGLHYTKENTL